MAIEVVPLDIADATVAGQVWRLQRAAYAVEAKLVGFDGIPPLYETQEALVTASLQWLGVEKGGRLVAALAYRMVDDLVDIDRLVVAPDRFRRGYGSALVMALAGATTVTVSTGTANEPAHRLYESLGFCREADEEVVPGMWITHFVRKALE